MSAIRHVLLIGEMGSGKTTIGSALADRLDTPFLDSDAVLEARTGETGSSIADREGVDRLHELELDVFLEMTTQGERSVIGSAASVIDSERGRRVIAEHFAIWVDAADDILVERQRSGSHRRLVHPVERGRLRQLRSKHYAAISEIRIDTGTQPVDESVKQALEALDAADP